MDETDIATWVQGNVPEVVLLIGGVLAIAIVASYVASKGASWQYKVLMALGLVFGAVMAFEAVISYGSWRMMTSVLVVVAAFALMIRPFRDVHVAIILSLFVMAIVYLAMGGFAGVVVADQIDLSFLAEGWPRIIVAFIFGAFVYLITNFAEELVKLFGRILNFWPVLLLLGIACVAEAVLMFSGNGSLADYLDVATKALN